jgi:Protein of unknown function (DUF3180)
VRFTRAGDLLAAGVVAAVLANLLLRLSYGDVPTLPRLAGTTLLAFAIAEVVLGNMLRARIRRRPGTRPVQALTAVKAVVLAKASSLAGAITGGAWLGALGYVLPQRSQLPAAASGTVAGALLPDPGGSRRLGPGRRLTCPGTRAGLAVSDLPDSTRTRRPVTLTDATMVTAAGLSVNSTSPTLCARPTSVRSSSRLRAAHRRQKGAICGCRGLPVHEVCVVSGFVP